MRACEVLFVGGMHIGGVLGSPMIKRISGILKLVSHRLKTG